MDNLKKIELITAAEKEAMNKSLQTLGDCMDTKKESVSQEDLRYVYSAVDSVYNAMYRMEERLYAGLSKYTLLPKLTPSQLEKLLAAAGAEGDFVVEKRYAVASEREGSKLNVSITHKAD